jgi:acetylornithine/N-succinyldiaminopimelate aminotransferase
MKKSEQYIAIDNEYYLQVFKRFPVVLERGQGARVWDVDGKEYIDALAGIAVNSLGHCHPSVVKAIQQQAETLIHVSNYFVNEPQALLAEKLATLSGLDRVFFTNSGAESVEGAIKLARKYAHSIGRGGTIVSMTGSFHGRTMATIATGKKSMQNGFEPIPGGFVQIAFNDIEALQKVISNDVAAVIIEPIQGEGGVNVAAKQYLQQVRALCTENHIVFIADEIQCGVARTGYWFAKDYFGIQPDIMTLAKGLGSGVPIGAVLCSQRINDAMNYGDHGTTFGGNPLVCNAALATLHTIEEENILESVREKGQWLRDKIIAMGNPHMKQVKGLGLMLGVEYDFETKPLALDMLNRGVLVNATAENILRLVPPLVIEYDEMEMVLNALRFALDEVTV